MRATEGRLLPPPAGTAHQHLPPTPPAEQVSTASAPAPEGSHAGASALVSAPSHCAPGALQPKVRKPYTITKQRERWTDKEHHKFLEALKLYGRAWRRIEEHIGTKTAIQIRSHAQKFFTKLEREGSLDGSVYSEEFNIPPPRLKRKPAHPYPRKAVVDPTQSSISTAANTSGSDAVSDIQQNEPGQQARPVVANGLEHPGINISSTLASTKNASASSCPLPPSPTLEDDKRTLRLFGKIVNQALNKQMIEQIKDSIGAHKPALLKASAGLVGQLVSTELTLAEQPSACKSSSAVQAAASVGDSAQDVAEASHRAWQESEKWVARAAELQHAAHVMAHMPTAASHMSTTHVRPVITDELPASKRAAVAAPRSAVPTPPPLQYPYLPALPRDVPLNMPLPPNTSLPAYAQFSTFDYYASRSAHHCHQGCTHPAHLLPPNTFGPWGYPPSVPALWPPQHQSDATAAAAAGVAATSAWYAMHGGNLPPSYSYPPASPPMPHYDPHLRVPETTLRAPSPAPIAPLATTAATTTVTTSAAPGPAHGPGLTLSLPSSPPPPSAVLRAERASKLRELKARRSSGGLSTTGEVADDAQGRNVVTAAALPLATAREHGTPSVFVPTNLKLVRDTTDAAGPALARAHGIAAVVPSPEGNTAADQKGMNNSNSNRSSTPSSAVINGGSDNQLGSDGSGSGSDEANHNNNVKSLSSRSSAANVSLDNSGQGWTSSSDEDDAREPNRSGSGSDSKELEQSSKIQRDGSDESLLSKQDASSPQAAHPSLIRQRSFHDLHEAEQQRSKVARTELTLLPGPGVPSAEGRMAFNMLFQQSPLPQSFSTREHMSPPFTMPINHATTAVRNLPFAAGYGNGTHLQLASPTTGYALSVQRPVPEVPHLTLAQDQHNRLTVDPNAGPSTALIAEPMQLSPSNRPRTQGALDLMLQQPASAASVAAQQRLTALCRSSSEGNILSLNSLSGGVFPASGFIPYRNNYSAYAGNVSIVHNSGGFGAGVSSPLAPMLALRRPSACGCDNLRTCNECLSPTKQLECEYHVVTAAEG
eukprot:jgi/Chlat1/6770/Chrsp50S06468